MGEPRDLTVKDARRGRCVAFLFGVLAAGVALGALGMRVAGSRAVPAVAPLAGPAAPAPAPAPAPPRALYQCPMHPAITSERPGDCPICGMKLVRMAAPATEPTGKAAPQVAAAARFHCPMHPQITSEHPGDCPICGMKLVPAPAAAAGEGAGRAPAAPVDKRATVSIDTARQQLIGLRLAHATRAAIGSTWRTVARVQVDPTRVRKINVKVEGFVERIFVDFVGQSVRKGQPLFSVYSPTLLAAQSEYLLALETKDALAARGASLADAARRRLELFDVPATELERLADTREPSKTLTLVSPIAGVVTAKDVVQGARVGPGEAPYEITDLGTVWAMADAYEGDLRRIRVGMKAVLTLTAYPGRGFPGTVAFVDPLLDPQTRTAKVHLHFANPKRELKPGMYGEVELETRARAGLTIPVDAVLRAGQRDVVFVALGQGKFEPREVELGVKSGDRVEISRGLEEGEAVVTRANFLVDSESQLRASLAAIGGD